MRHWTALRDRLGADAVEAEPLLDGIAAGRALLGELAELTPRYGLHVDTAAQSVGVAAGSARNLLGDRFLERNQALRMAVLDVQHVVTLLEYLAELSAATATEPVRALCARYDRVLRPVERAFRRAAVESGSEPDAAIAPADGSSIGRAAHGVAVTIGTVGEWVDRRLGSR